MTSYFESKPAAAKLAVPASPTDATIAEVFGRASLLSPQVTRILDDPDLDDRSGSDDADASDEDPSNKDASTDDKSKTSDTLAKHQKAGPSSAQKSRDKKEKGAKADGNLSRPGLRGSPKHPHLTKLQSLRSMLFTSHLEESLSKMDKSDGEAPREAQWKTDHEQRKGLNRPKTPEDSPKEGLRQRFGQSLRRLTTKEVPTLKQVQEQEEPVNDNASTASSDDEAPSRKSKWIVDDYDDGEISHSDVEDLVRWVSKRDPPSDGEVRGTKSKVKQIVEEEDSGDDSFGHSDVDDLVHWVSRRDQPSTEPMKAVKSKRAPQSAQALQPATQERRYSNASTASDSDAPTTRKKRGETLKDDDVDDLVRWVSRREGANAGPVHEKQAAKPARTRAGSQLAGEVSSAPAAQADGNVALPVTESNATLDDEDVDDLVRWVSKENADPKEIANEEEEISKWKAEEDAMIKKTGAATK